VAVTSTGGPTRQESVTHIKRHKLASCNVPLVHGRPNPSISPRSRLTTHQRNHSLDFRYIYFDCVIPVIPVIARKNSNLSRKAISQIFPSHFASHARELFASRDASGARVYTSWHLLNKRS